MGNFVIFWAHGVTHMRFDFLDTIPKKTFSPGKNFTFEKATRVEVKTPRIEVEGKKDFCEMKTKSHIWTKKKSPKKVKKF